MTVMQKTCALFALMVSILLVAWWPSVLHLLDIVWNVDVYSHALIVPFASIWLVWRNFEDGGHVGPPSVWGAVALVPITLLWMVGSAMEAGILQHLALVLAVQSLFLACFGWQAMKRNLFPLAFLFLVIPFGGGFVVPLQRITADMVIFLLQVTGVEFQAEGVLIELSNGLYEIAAACAGLKFLFTSVVTGVLLCYLAFESWTRRLVMLFASVLVPILANTGRVYTTLLIAEATDQDFAKSIDHVVYGWVFLSFVLFILIAIAYRFSDRREEATAVSRSAPSGVGGVRAWHALIFVPIVAAIWMNQSAQTGTTVCNTESGPPPMCEECGYRLLPATHTQGVYQFEGTDADKHFMYRRGGERFSVIAGLFAPDRENHRVIQATYRGLQDDWLVLDGADVANQTVGGVQYNEMVMWRGNDRALVWRAYFADGQFAKGASDAKLRLGMARLAGRRPDAAALVFIHDMTGGLEEGRAELEKFLSTFPPDRFLWSELTTAKGETVCAE